MKVRIVSAEELPAWAKEDDDYSYGNDYRNYLVIEDGDYKKVYTDGGEPEDASFGRDYSWVALELRRAYKSGMESRKT
jgi:hypothetical protein